MSSTVLVGWFRFPPERLCRHRRYLFEISREFPLLPKRELVEGFRL